MPRKVTKSPSGYDLYPYQRARYMVVKPYVDGLPWFVFKAQLCNQFVPPNHYALAYKVTQVNPDGSREVIFEGDDISVPGHRKDCTREHVRQVIFFASLQEGDTDPEFFEGETERQTQFRKEHAEALSTFAEDPAERARERAWERKHAGK